MIFPDLNEVIIEYDEFHRKKQGKDARRVDIIIPDRNEDPNKAVKTVEFSATANLEAALKYDIPKRVVDSICLSDQSTKPGYATETRKILKQTVSKLRTWFEEHGCQDLMPEIRYLRVSDNMKDVILQNSQGLEGLANSIKEQEEIYGKGANMYLSTLITQKLADSENPGLLFLDADYRNRNKEQVLALALPLSHMIKYNAVTGTFTRYHKNEEGRMERGGRVNASTRAIFDMIYECGRMNKRGYPLCGDQGATTEVLDRLRWPRRFGIESAWRIQAHSYENGFNATGYPLLLGKKSFQVDIGGSDDIPVGHGKPKDRVIEEVKDMTYQVISSTLATIGRDRLRARWPTPENFMEDFTPLQSRNLRSWKNQSEKDFGYELPISGGITDYELKQMSLEATRETVEKFYSNPEEETRLRADFLPSIKQLKQSKGEDYNSFVDKLAENIEVL